MYQNFYGLRELPFELTPNPKYLFLPPQHREALSALEYGLSSAKPITVLIGEAGTGKTTLIHAALESERCRGVRCVYVNNPLLTRKEFVETLSHRFGLSAQAAASKAVLLNELGSVLQAGRDRGEITALVIDEAQGMSGTLLEEIRLLANQETTTRRLLPVVLAGQPELSYRLNETGLRQLKQRVTLRCEVTPFDLRQTAAYIGHRVRVAGGDAGRLFTREAVMLIHERSGGIPRTISVICDNALLTGFAHTIAALLVLRLLWRWLNPVPELPGEAWERYAAKLGHVALYVLMFASTLTGWALERGVPLEGLTVDRPSLEDVYLALISEEDDG
jgi:general secretion pathway protein A